VEIFFLLSPCAFSMCESRTHMETCTISSSKVESFATS
jgi:hypothetical protein